MFFYVIFVPTLFWVYLLQVEDTKYVFEAKTIQRMELLVLSALGWKMHPVTPISFVDHIVRRLGLKSNVHWEFLTRCHSFLVCLVSGNILYKYIRFELFFPLGRVID